MWLSAFVYDFGHGGCQPIDCGRAKMGDHIRVNAVSPCCFAVFYGFDGLLHIVECYLQGKEESCLRPLYQTYAKTKINPALGLLRKLNMLTFAFFFILQVLVGTRTQEFPQ